MFCTYFWSRWLLGDHYEGIPFVDADFWARQNITNHSETLLIIRSDAGGLRPPDPPAIMMFFPSEYAKKLDLAETIRMVQSRASGRPSLSRYGHFCIDNLPFPDRTTTNP